MSHGGIAIINTRVLCFAFHCGAYDVIIIDNSFFTMCYSLPIITDFIQLVGVQNKTFFLKCSNLIRRSRFIFKYFTLELELTISKHSFMESCFQEAVLT